MSQMFKLSIYLPLFCLLSFTLISYPYKNARFYLSTELEVLDGDTVKILQTGEKIRLYGIDAPELSQKSFDGKAVGEYSKNHLAKLIGDSSVKIQAFGIGYYGRTIGLLFNEQKKNSINFHMIKDGYAIILIGIKYRSSQQKRQWNQGFISAFRLRQGLWKTQGFYSPKTYRKKVRALNREGIYIKL